MSNTAYSSDLISSGLPGLDVILGGGFPKGWAYLIVGPSGAGKTTLGTQFLLEGVRAGERVMLVSMIETRDELLAAATSHGWDLSQVNIMELPEKVRESAHTLQTVFPPGEVEFNEIADTVIENIRRYRPQRLLIDSISQLSMLTDSWYQMRDSILKLRDLTHSQGCTALFTSNEIEGQIAKLNTIVHGSIFMDMKAPAYGRIRRELIVSKMRGQKFITGYHNFRVHTGGIEIYTWRPTGLNTGHNDWQVLSSGIKSLDVLLGGGLEEGTACMVTGSSGAGKSTFSSLYVQAAAKRGQRSIIFCFDERKETFLRRSNVLNLEMCSYIDQGLVELRQVNASDLSPGEFAQIVRRAVEKKNAKVVLIDSLTGYLNAMPEENLLMTQLYELLSYLNGVGVLSILVVSKYSLWGERDSQIDASYIADTVVLLRHFEAMGKIRHCITVVKKRHGNHEHAIREFKIASGGCEVGPPLTDFRGVLTGNPTYVGKPDNLLEYP